MIVISRTCTKIVLIRSTFSAPNTPNVVWRVSRLRPRTRWEFKHSPGFTCNGAGRAKNKKREEKGREQEGQKETEGTKGRQRRKGELRSHKTFQKSATLIGFNVPKALQIEK